MSNILYALAEAGSATTILGMTPFELVLAITAIIGMITGIIYVFQNQEGNRQVKRQNDLTERGTAMAPVNKFTSRAAYKSFLPSVLMLIASALMWAVVLYNGGYAQSGFNSTCILLVVILALLVVVLMKRKNSMGQSVASQSMPDPQVRITYPTARNKVSAGKDKVPVEGTFASRPEGTWMLWTSVDSVYWPQEHIAIKPDGKHWTARVSISLREKTTILVVKATPEIICLEEYYYAVHKQFEIWKGIRITNPQDVLKPVEEMELPIENITT